MLVNTHTVVLDAHWRPLRAYDNVSGEVHGSLHTLHTVGVPSARRPGPGSTAWRINGERLSVLGWGRAILLQLAHPLVAEGVAAHSTFRGSPHAGALRFHSTLRAMLALTFGSDAEARAAVARIRSIHDGVNGTLPHRAGAIQAGAEYSAHDPALLAWVHLTLVDSMPRAYGRFVMPVDDDDVSQYAEDSRWSAELIGARPADLPRTAADVRGRLEHSVASGVLAVTDTARTLAQAVLNPPLRSLTGPLGRVHALAAVGDLPPAIRDAYGLPWTASDARSLEAWSQRLQACSRSAPERVRRWRPARRATRGDPARPVT